MWESGEWGWNFVFKKDLSRWWKKLYSEIHSISRSRSRDIIENFSKFLYLFNWVESAKIIWEKCYSFELSNPIRVEDSPWLKIRLLNMWITLSVIFIVVLWIMERNFHLPFVMIIIAIFMGYHTDWWQIIIYTGNISSICEFLMWITEFAIKI